MEHTSRRVFLWAVVLAVGVTLLHLREDFAQIIQREGTKNATGHGSDLLSTERTSEISSNLRSSESNGTGGSSPVPRPATNAPGSRSDPPPPSPTVGYVHYATNEFAGWNNQREAAMVAWLVAYFAGHTLDLKPFHPAYTGVLSDQSGDYKHGDLWDLKALGRYVKLRNISYQTTPDGYDFKLDLGSVFYSADDVRRLSNYTTISYTAGWAPLQRTFPFVDPFAPPGSTSFRHMIESFTYNRRIQEIAEAIVKEMTPFVALHVRSGRPPALNCTEVGEETVVESDMYQRGACRHITWANVVDRVLPGNKLPVYVAHDGRFANGTIPGAVQGSDFQILRELPLAIASAVEQVVAIRAEYFVASAHSSWSEYVVYQRVYDAKDGKKNYDIWVKNLDLFLGKAR
jgi:hypothetical protein